MTCAGDGLKSDRIDLSAFAAVGSIGDLNLQSHPDRLVIDLGGHGGGTVTLDGVVPTGDAPYRLTDADFIFFADDGALIG